MGMDKNSRTALTALLGLALSPLPVLSQAVAVMPRAVGLLSSEAPAPNPVFAKDQDRLLWQVQDWNTYLTQAKKGDPVADKFLPLFSWLKDRASKTESPDELSRMDSDFKALEQALLKELLPDLESLPKEEREAAVERLQTQKKILVSLQRSRVRMGATHQRSLDFLTAKSLTADDGAALSAFYDRLRGYGPGDSPIVTAGAVHDLAMSMGRSQASPGGAEQPSAPSGGLDIPSPVEWPIPAAQGTADEESAAKTARELGMREDIVRLAFREARKQGVDYRLVLAVIEQESSFDPRATSAVGARGLMQIMPATGRGLGVRNANDLYNPMVNLRAGIGYLKDLWNQFSDVTFAQLGSINPSTNQQVKMAIAAYNAGPGAVGKYGNVPPYRETRDYVAKVLRNYVEFRRIFPN